MHGKIFTDKEEFEQVSKNVRGYGVIFSTVQTEEGFRLEIPDVELKHLPKVDGEPSLPLDGGDSYPVEHLWDRPEKFRYMEKEIRGRRMKIFEGMDGFHKTVVMVAALFSFVVVAIASTYASRPPREVVEKVVYIESGERRYKEKMYMMGQIDEILNNGWEHNNSAYEEGRQDAKNGDIRIERIDDDWAWIKSPWNDRPLEYWMHDLFSEY